MNKLAIAFLLLYATILIYGQFTPIHRKISERPIYKVVPVAGRQRTASQKKPIQIYKLTYSNFGIASYYSTKGCIGCSKNLIMANGNPLNDNAFTIANNDLPLGTKVRVENPQTKLAIYAKVTDRGGFNKLGRIADLSIAVKNAIQCTDLCKVRLVVYK